MSIFKNLADVVEIEHWRMPSFIITDILLLAQPEVMYAEGASYLHSL